MSGLLKCTGVSPLIILFIIPALGLHLSIGIPSSSCFLVDAVQGCFLGGQFFVCFLKLFFPYRNVGLNS